MGREINDYFPDEWTIDGVPYRYDLSRDQYVTGDGENKRDADFAVADRIRRMQVAEREEQEIGAIKSIVSLFGNLPPISRKNVLAYINEKYSA